MVEKKVVSLAGSLAMKKVVKMVVSTAAN